MLVSSFARFLSKIAVICPTNRVFLSLLVAFERRRGTTQILFVNVYRVAPPPGGGGYYKSPPFIVQYSCPHVFQYSEVF